MPCSLLNEAEFSCVGISNSFTFSSLKHPPGGALITIENELNENMYRTVVTPALLYGAETWAEKKAQEKKLGAAEIQCYDGCAELQSSTIRSERIIQQK